MLAQWDVRLGEYFQIQISLKKFIKYHPKLKIPLILLEIFYQNSSIRLATQIAYCIVLQMQLVLTYIHFPYAMSVFLLCYFV